MKNLMNKRSIPDKRLNGTISIRYNGSIAQLVQLIKYSFSPSLNQKQSCLTLAELLNAKTFGFSVVLFFLVLQVQHIMSIITAIPARLMELWVSILDLSFK